MKLLITLWANAASWHKRSTRLGITGWVKWSTRNCVRDWNLTILPNSICTNQNPFLENEIYKILWYFEIQADHLTLVRINKYVDLARELKKLWNIKMKVIPLVLIVLGALPKGLERGLEQLEIKERIKTIQTTALLRLARILRRVLETWEDLLLLRSR